MFCKNGFLRDFADFTGKHLCQSLFFNKVSDLSPATLLKKRLCHRCFKSGSRTAATSKMEGFVIIVNSFLPLTIIKKRSILDVAAILDPPLCFPVNLSKLLRIPFLIEKLWWLLLSRSEKIVF